MFAAYFWKWQGTTKIPVFQNPVVILQKAESGKVVAGFPEGLIVDSQATEIHSAENSSTKANTQTLVTSYLTKVSLTDLSKQYGDYFKKNSDWIVLSNKADAEQLSISAFSPILGSIEVNAFKKENTAGFLITIVFNKNIIK
jgi:hypothetical protein